MIYYEIYAILLEINSQKSISRKVDLLSLNFHIFILIPRLQGAEI